MHSSAIRWRRDVTGPGGRFARVTATISLCSVCATGFAGAQPQTPALDIGRPSRVAITGLLRSASSAHVLSDGALLVNDILGRQLVLVSPTLQQAVVLADSSGRAESMYLSRAMGLIPWCNDSTWAMDPVSLSLTLYDGKGQLARVVANPFPAEAPFMIGGPFGAPAADPAGRIIFRGAYRPRLAPGPPEPGETLVTQPDTLPLLRASLADHRIDTIAWVRIPATKSRIRVSDRGISITTIANPLATADVWAVATDGTVIVVRGADFHLERRSPSGEWRSAPRVPFPWRRLSDDERRAIVDSVRSQLTAERADRVAGGGNDQAATRVQPVEVVPASELPDYEPAFPQGSARLDPEGRLWVRTAERASDRIVFYRFDAELRLSARILVPLGRSLIGFGGREAFFAVRDGEWVRIEAYPNPR